MQRVHARTAQGLSFGDRLDPERSLQIHRSTIVVIAQVRRGTLEPSCTR
jgi:hypothetical protein